MPTKKGTASGGEKEAGERGTSGVLKAEHPDPKTSADKRKRKQKRMLERRGKRQK